MVVVGPELTKGQRGFVGLDVTPPSVSIDRDRDVRATLIALGIRGSNRKSEGGSYIEHGDRGARTTEFRVSTVGGDNCLRSQGQ